MRSISVCNSQDEKLFEAFKSNLLVTATAHSCEEVLHPHYIPGQNEDGQELIQQKQYFMYSVFNKVLQSDLGKTIVRRHAPTLDTESYWREMNLICPHHPKDSMKGTDS